jgi:hypothetical protein
MEWRHSGSAHQSQKFPSAKFGWKVLGSIFWYQKGIHLIEYLPKGQTLNVEYYSSLLAQLKDILNEKPRSREGHQGGVLHDNVPACREFAIEKKLACSTWALNVLIMHPIRWIWPRRTTTCFLD